jgi:hypothetical protein
MMEKQTFGIGERVDKLCAACGVERGHVVASVTKRGQVSRVSCPACGTRSSYKNSTASTSSASASAKVGAPYDPKRTYRTGQMLVHPSFGPGEVTAIIEPQKIDVLFADRLRRLIHARS